MVFSGSQDWVIAGKVGKGKEHTRDVEREWFHSCSLGSSLVRQ